MNILKMLVGTAAFLLASISSASTPQTFLSMWSDPGDLVGQGQTYYLTFPVDGHLVLNTYQNQVGLNFWLDTSFTHEPNPLPSWTGNFSTAGLGAPLAIGQYDNATSPSTADSPYPGIEISYGDGRPSSTTGSFHIYDIGLNSYGGIDHVAMSFEQYSNGSSAALHGLFWDNSAFPLPAVPEPETYAELLAGLGLLVIRFRRRKLESSQEHGIGTSGPERPRLAAGFLVSSMSISAPSPSAGSPAGRCLRHYRSPPPSIDSCRPPARSSMA